MTFWQVIGFLITGGALGLVGGVVTTLMTNRSEERRAKRQRDDTISDRNFSIKKDIYAAVLQHYDEVGFAHHIGKSVHEASSIEKVEEHSKNMTLLNMFAPESVKQKLTPVLKLSGMNVPKPDTKEHDIHMGEVHDKINGLRDAMAEDLGIE